ncbi:MAG TPA: PIN domain-containing protein [Dehalococcoidia bacterium]|nr:PIN domain-containing protein [Dehalococcoidia bacterium]
MPIAVVDAGPLYASVDADDDDHERSAAVLQRADLRLIVPALVVAEVTYLVGRRLGARIESRFLAGLREVSVQSPFSEDWERIAELVDRYANFPLGGTDASVVALAERLNTDLVVSLDRRHFGAVQPATAPDCGCCRSSVD